MPQTPLPTEYQKQYRLRDWNTAYTHLPDLKGKTILDLGCGPGDQTKDLSSRGAHVIGIDASQSLLTTARARDIPNTTFIETDLRSLPENKIPQCDGIWASFVAAYFTELTPVLKHWTKFLKPGGWMALTEISGLFDHEPLKNETKAMIRDFYIDAMKTSQYDFNSGEKLSQALTGAGLKVKHEVLLRDLEFSVNGPLSNEAIDSWTARLGRMKGLKTFLGSKSAAFEREFLACLADSDHKSDCKVVFVLATVT